jgi:ElaB/YqjD/DUF883 family membrane-anchored ribosome-binding protein
MSNHTEEIRNDINALAEDARTLMADTGHLAGEKVAAARQRLAAALEGAQQICGRVRLKTMGTARAADQLVRDHPYQALGIALGVGALIGFLLMRRKNGTSTTEECEKSTSN